LTFTAANLDTELRSPSGTASGFFIYDANTNTYSNWNILVSNFSAGFSQGNADATPATSSIQPTHFGLFGPPGPRSVGFSYSSDQALLWLDFNSPLSNSGGVVGVSAMILDAGNGYYCWSAGGTASTVVPEPASALPLLGGIGFCVLFLLLHRRRQMSAHSTKSADA
jgi:hypothetical protein